MGKNYNLIAEKISGPLAPITTAFNNDGSIDLDSTCSWIDWMIENGINLFWTTYGTSHYFCMTDDEIISLTKAVADTIGKRGILIASTNFNWPLRKAVDFIEFANNCGVDVVKLQVDWRWSPESEDVFFFYNSIAKQSPLPLFAYTLTSQGMSCDLFSRILQIPQFIGMKNDTGDFYENCKYLARVRESGKPFHVMTGGAPSAFLHSSNFGAKAYADVIAMLNPKKSLEFFDCINNGNLKSATDIIIKYEEPYMRSAGFSSDKESTRAVLHGILYVKGLFKSNFLRFPMSNIKGNLIEILSKYHPREELCKV